MAKRIKLFEAFENTELKGVSNFLKPLASYKSETHAYDLADYSLVFKDLYRLPGCVIFKGKHGQTTITQESVALQMVKDLKTLNAKHSNVKAIKDAAEVINAAEAAGKSAHIDIANPHNYQIGALIDYLKQNATAAGIDTNSNHFDAIIPHLTQKSLLTSTEMPAKLMLEGKLNDYLASQTKAKGLIKEITSKYCGVMIDRLSPEFLIQQENQGKMHIQISQSFKINPQVLQQIKIEFDNHIDESSLSLEKIKQIKFDFNKTYTRLIELSQQQTNGFVKIKTAFNVECENIMTTNVYHVTPVKAEAQPYGKLGLKILPDHHVFGEKLLVKLKAFFEKLFLRSATPVAEAKNTDADNLSSISDTESTASTLSP